MKVLLPQGIKETKQKNSKDKFVLKFHWRLAVTVEVMDVCMPFLIPARMHISRLVLTFFPLF